MRLARCSLAAEVLYWRLCDHADGLGDYPADSVSLADLIKDRVANKSIDIADVPHLRSELEENRLVEIYNVKEREYIHINSFNKVDESKQKFPAYKGYKATDKHKYIIIADRIIDYLNNRRQDVGLSGKFRKGPHRPNIIARLREGYTEEDFLLLIDYMINEWVGTKWEKYLTPATLFRPTKFDTRVVSARWWRDNNKRRHVDGIKYYGGDEYNHIGEMSQ